MVLYVVGLGLGDEQDITLRGLNAVKKSKKVFLENYTSVLGIELSRLVRTHALVSERHGIAFSIGAVGLMVLWL